MSNTRRIKTRPQNAPPLGLVAAMVDNNTDATEKALDLLVEMAKRQTEADERIAELAERVAELEKAQAPQKVARVSRTHAESRQRDEDVHAFLGTLPGVYVPLDVIAQAVKIEARHDVDSSCRRLLKDKRVTHRKGTAGLVEFAAVSGA